VFDSRVSVVGANPSVELRYIVFGTSSDLTAKSELADESPDEYDGLPRQSIQIELVRSRLGVPAPYLSRY